MPKLKMCTSKCTFACAHTVASVVFRVACIEVKRHFLFGTLHSRSLLGIAVSSGCTDLRCLSIPVGVFNHLVPIEDSLDLFAIIDYSTAGSHIIVRTHIIVL